MSLKLLIFDLDGTLVNAYPAVAKSVNFTLKQLGFPPKTFNQIKRAVGWGDRELLAQFVGQELADKALLFYRPHHLKALKTGVRFLPGAKVLLKWAKSQGFRLAIATNRPSMFTHEILKGLKVDKDFDCILCADQAKKPKPHADMLLSICRTLKTNKEEAWYVGDMTIDVNCGNNAKVKTIAVATGSSTKKELKELNPYRIIGTINQLKNIIKETL
jgi:phosphoglycolate phosphatase